MIGRGLHPLLPRPAPILSADRDGQGHRDHGAPPPGAYPRAPTQSTASPIALWIGSLVALSQLLRDGAGAPSSSRPIPCSAGTGSSRDASGNVGEPSEVMDVPRSATRSSGSTSDSAGRTRSGAVSASRASFRGLGNSPDQTPASHAGHAFTTIEVLVPYTFTVGPPVATSGAVLTCPEPSLTPTSATNRPPARGWPNTAEPRGGRDPHAKTMVHQPRSAEKVRQMWCKCGARRPWTRHEGPISAPRTAVTWTFFGADDGIRTRDPHLGKVMESVHPVLLRPSTWAPSVSSSGKCCRIRPVVTRVTTGRQPGPRLHAE